MTPSGNSAGAPRNAEDAADLAWLQDTARAGIASRPAHHATVEWQPGDYFRAWCPTCSRYVSAKGRDKAVQQFLAGAHEREKAQ